MKLLKNVLQKKYIIIGKCIIKAKSQNFITIGTSNCRVIFLGQQTLTISTSQQNHAKHQEGIQ